MQEDAHDAKNDKDPSYLFIRQQCASTGKQMTVISALQAPGGRRCQPALQNVSSGQSHIGRCKEGGIHQD